MSPAQLHQDFQDLRTDFRRTKVELIRWMFVCWFTYWLATVVPIAGLLLYAR